jgi:hypothetical protein
MALYETASPGPAWDKEHRHLFSGVNPSWDHVIFSGSTNIAGSQGEPGDKWIENTYHLIVGPWWKDVQRVVPYVTMNGFANDNWDEVDKAGWNISDLDWDTVGGTTQPHINEERIRLKFTIAIKGKDSSLFRIAYHVTAAGRGIGEKGINSPDPGVNQ